MSLTQILTMVSFFLISLPTQGKILFKLSKPIDFTANTVIKKKTMASAMGRRWTIIAKIKPEKLLNGFSPEAPHTILMLTKSNSKKMLVLCLKNKIPNIGVRLAPGKGRSVQADKPVPLNYITQIAVVYNDAKLQFFVNGRFASKILKLKADEYDTICIGRRGNNRKFIGSISQLLIVDEVYSQQKLLKFAENLTGQKPPPATFPLKQEQKYPRYKMLKCAPDKMQIINNSGGAAVVLPWKGPNDKSLLISSFERFLGGGVFLYIVASTRSDGMPDYRLSQILKLKGTKLQKVPRQDGMFDLLTLAGQKFYLYRNSGKKGAPVFESAGVEVPLDWDAVTSVPIANFALGDVDGDGMVDLLLTAGKQNGYSYWPDNQKPWRHRELPNTGPGKGYDIVGNWLGRRFNCALYVARGERNENGISFAKPEKVYVGNADFQLQWRVYGAMVPALLEADGDKWIVLFGDCDQLLALPLRKSNDKKTIRCGPAVSLLKGNARTKGLYFGAALDCTDLDGDGQSEVVAYGCRAIVFKGPRPGEFVELEPLCCRGGTVGSDTLAVPCRIDWNGDRFPDLIIGDASGYLSFRSGTGNPLVYDSPKWFSAAGRQIHHQAGPTGSFQGPSERRWGYLQPTVGDWDGDGRPEIITNDIKAQMFLYRRGKSMLDLQSPMQFMMHGKPLPVAWRSRPAILPGKYKFAGDRRPCLLYMDYAGDLAVGIPEKTGSTVIAKSIKLKYDNGEKIHISAPCGMWGRTKFAICDWDGDGRWDIVFGTNKGTQRVVKSVKPGTDSTPFFMRNVGTDSQPVFKYPQPIKLKDGKMIDFDVHICSVWPTDLNGNGKPDLIAGGEDGRVYYFYRDELNIPSVSNFDNALKGK